MTSPNSRGIEEILRKFKTTIMWETEHEEGLLMSNHDALEWLRVALISLEKSHLEELSELGAGITNGYEDILRKTEQTHHQELQKARAEMLHKLHLCAIGKYEGDALENVKAQIKEYQSELDQPKQ